MKDNKRVKYILHVSDFHLSSETLDFAEKGLKRLSDELDDRDIPIDYLIHTGDIIDSWNAHLIAAQDICQKEKMEWIKEYISGDEFNEDGFKKDPRTTDDILLEINNIIHKNTAMLYQNCVLLVRNFLSDLCVRKKNTFFCVGNHDTIRPIERAEPPKCERFKCDDGDATDYHEYLKKYETKNKIFDAYSVSFLNELDLVSPISREISEENKDKKSSDPSDINVVFLNTNHRNPYKAKEGYYCIDCLDITDRLNEMIEQQDASRLNIVVAHKPIYEICEAARMAFSSYHKTEFMTALQNYLGDNGIYICGDKHTRSVSDTTFHSVHHIIGGAPLKMGATDTEFHVEYNLIEVCNGRAGNIQKIHLSYSDESKEWECVFRPEDQIVSRLYELSSNSVIPQCLSVLALDSKHNNWSDISRIFYKEKKNDPRWLGLEKSLDELYRVICKYGKMSPNLFGNSFLKSWDMRKSTDSVFKCFRNYLSKKINYRDSLGQQNILNIRGEYSSGKSTFLGILYIYLLHQYSIGTIDFIPAYFNLENKRILKKIHVISEKSTYFEAAVQSFQNFVSEVQKIAKATHMPVCYIIDGLDEQDVWSYCSEDSVGRGILDVLNSADNSINIMSFSQHHLPLFKNTMPERKYKDISDVMYFNTVNIISADEQKALFSQFVNAFYSLANGKKDSQMETVNVLTESPSVLEKTALIRKFQRLSVSQHFLYKFDGYFVEKIANTPNLDALTFSEVYRDYIDLLHKMCLEILGYGYVHYAPAMAYLFSFKGFTYERFKRIQFNADDFWQNKIAEHSDRVYDAFIFIKKNQDIREYLIAMHYNRELRFYAENPDVPISENSILNEFITKNIAVLSRVMWKSDPNKFVIVCEALLEKRYELGQKPLCNCALSMLIYTLAHQAKMYEPSNKMLDKLIRSYSTSSGPICENPSQGFKFTVPTADPLQLFLDYSIYRTYRIYKAEIEGNSEKLAIQMESDKEFSLYNRQYFRLYYGDITISGENRKEALVPGQDICLKGFDFHNTFSFLSEKLRNIESQPYPLMAFDLYSLCDLIQERLTVSANSNNQQNMGTFFSGKKNIDTQLGVLNNAINFIDAYCNQYTDQDNKEICIIQFLNTLEKFRKNFLAAIKERDSEQDCAGQK